MSNKYGLGADNILEAEIVTPTGTLLTANANSNPDLYWAIRGGGGSTFGIVTKLTYKTHPFLTQNALRMTITPDSTGPDGYTKGMAYLMSQMPRFTDFGMTGYPVMRATKYECLFLAPGKEWDEITTFIDPVIDELEKKMGLKVSSLRIESAANALLGSYGLTPHFDTGFKTGTAVMSSRLISREAALNVTNWERVLTTLFAAGTILEPFPVVGGQVSKNADMDMALNPAWRKAVIHFSILDANSDSLQTSGAIRASYERQTKEQLPLIDEMSVDGAAYFNEVRAFSLSTPRRFRRILLTMSCLGNLSRTELAKDVLGSQLCETRRGEEEVRSKQHTLVSSLRGLRSVGVGAGQQAV